MPNAYNYSNTAVQTTLGGNITGGATSLTVGATTGFPSTTPYVLAVDYGAATEELVVVTGVAGTTLTVTRGFSGTSAQSHSIGAVIRHVVNAQDLTDFRTHEAATSDVHGVTGALVGATSTQTLTNKTLTSPTINGATLSGTFAGAHTYSGAVTMSAGGTLTGTFTGNPTLSGNPTFSANTTFTGSVTAVTITGEVAHSNLFRGTRTISTDSQWESRQAGDSFARHFVQADGRHWWGSGAATVDTNLYRSAANVLKTDDAFEAANWPAGVWVSWTPTWGTTTGAGVPTYGNAVVDCKYTQHGKTVMFFMNITFGTTTNFGGGGSADNWTFTLPVTPAAAGIPVGAASLEPGSTVRATSGSAQTWASDASKVLLYVDSARVDGGSTAGGIADAVTPFTWTSGMRFTVVGQYESA